VCTVVTHVEIGVVHNKFSTEVILHVHLVVHSVTNWSAVHGDEALEAIAPVGRSGKSQPPPDTDLFDTSLERHGRHVVALVDNDKPVTV